MCLFVSTSRVLPGTQSIASISFSNILHRILALQAADYVGDDVVLEKASTVFAERLFRPGVVKDARWLCFFVCLCS